ncbi:Biotin carboxylase [Parafrankia sp. Ea1.12]|uniref:ATP-grasp domain-containing protein n=1 Tax=Parafrankia sp. Ea1.12 TaxID=573499 RepID=UPI000DA51337|nr:ATP-grasp domain-containing protein [Parafrankia sp. Ea1.12]SQD97622.1 Biotin carboxylase [Parafrankia sp. Ea1.12]
MTAAILFVESNTSGTGQIFVERAAALGLRPILVTAEPTRYPFASRPDLEVVVADTSDPGRVWSRCVSVLGAEFRPLGVWSSSEYYLPISARVAGMLGLPGPDAAAVSACRDKAHQRRIIAEAGLADVASVLVRTPDEAERFAEKVGLPVVVKPRAGSGSIGVRLCRSLDEVASQAGHLLGEQHDDRGPATGSGILVEEFLDGSEYSVEIMGGQAVGVVRKHLGPQPSFVEVGHDYPAPLAGDLEDRLVREAVAAVRALGLGWGPVHAELRLARGEEPVVIEVNPRLAGGFIPELIRHATGRDLIEEVIRMACALPEGVTVPSRPADGPRAASIRFLLRSAAPRVPVDVLRHSVRPPVHLLLYRTGDRAADDQATGDFRDRIGHVLAAATSIRESARLVEEALGNVTAPGAGPVDGKTPVADGRL